MPEFITKIPQQFRDFWGNLDKSNRNKLIITTVVAFLSVIIAVFMVSRPQYQPLFSHIDPKDTSEISKQLEKLNIGYRLEDDGTTILVKKQDINKAKVSLAEVGYPRKGMTYEDLNSTSLGTTDAERRKRYQLFKESELERALSEMDNIKNAIVKLTIPEQTAFFNAKTDPSKASIIIDAYDELNSKQINGIQRFIAGSVENLEVKDVTVLDNNGNILNEDYDDGITGSADRQYALRQMVTKNVEQQVAQLLSGLADNVRVMASLELDFDTLTTNKEIFEPVIDGKGIIRSSEEKKESVVNGVAGAVPGAEANPPQYPNAVAGENGEYKLSEETVNYEINRTVTQSSKEIGKMNKENSSIAVAMFTRNGQTSPAGDNTNVASAQVDVNKVKEIIASATGIPVEKVTVEVLDMPSVTEEKPALDIAEAVNTFGPIVLVLIIIGLLVLMIFRMRAEKEPEPELQTAAARFNVAVGDEEMLPDIDMEEKSEVKKQLDKFVKEKPDAVAQLLRNWLAEDWD
ncbi:flagellar basal-body MS-ring/collar protein FliF [Petroclostridium sp. X23]|uniref:flagellar basal-body MS-ring/collar protein FliF n=1 Tax=Petroclostridium sp. X23 TaxID=3045146 RepID=UPI0024AD66A7|nr:flagellar basal-body MS-ring/collar protein FliF [Petroclostridium sp. X23]WHH58930.1 flagellar basal-body MS-ring/collar protein FliF [Petroclostridium sp. X23]